MAERDCYSFFVFLIPLSFADKGLLLFLCVLDSFNLSLPERDPYSFSLFLISLVSAEADKNEFCPDITTLGIRLGVKHQFTYLLQLKLC